MPTRLEMRPLIIDKAKFLGESTLTRNQITLARKNLQPGSPLEATLSDRYETLERLLQAVETIVQIDPKTTPNVGAAFVSALTPFIDKYELEFKQGNPLMDASYIARMQNHAQIYKAKAPQFDRSDLSFATPTLNTFSKPGLKLYESTQPVGPHGAWDSHADVVSYTHIFNNFSHIQESVKSTPSNRTFETTDASLPKNVKYIYLETPATLLLLMGKSILWEGFDGNTVDLSMFATLINGMMEAFDIYVDVKP